MDFPSREWWPCIGIVMVGIPIFLQAFWTPMFHNITVWVYERLKADRRSGIDAEVEKLSCSGNSTFELVCVRALGIMRRLKSYSPHLYLAAVGAIYVKHWSMRGDDYYRCYE